MESVEFSKEYQFHRGYWTATEDMTRLMNSMDTEGMTNGELRSALYCAILDLRPYGKFKS